MTENPERFEIDKDVATKIQRALKEIYERTESLAGLVDNEKEWLAQLGEIRTLHAQNKSSANNLIQIDDNLKAEDSRQSNETEELVIWNQGNHYVGVTKNGVLEAVSVNERLGNGVAARPFCRDAC